MVGLRTERHLYPAAEGKTWNGVSSLETSERSSPVTRLTISVGLGVHARPHELFFRVSLQMTHAARTHARKHAEIPKQCSV